MLFSVPEQLQESEEVKKDNEILQTEGHEQ